MRMIFPFIFLNVRALVEVIYFRVFYYFKYKEREKLQMYISNLFTLYSFPLTQSGVLRHAF